MDRTSLRRIERLNYVLGGILVALTGLLGTRAQVLGALVGVLLCAVNFSVVIRLVEKMMRAARGETEGRGSALLLGPKLLALMGAAAAAIVFLPISPIMLAAGFSVFLLSIGAETVRHVLRSPGGSA